MADYIDREQAIEAMAELQGRASSKAELTGISKAWKRIKALPSADVEPVVRCKECRFFVDEGMYCESNILTQFDHFYCYYGERGEDNDD